MPVVGKSEVGAPGITSKESWHRWSHQRVVEPSTAPAARSTSRRAASPERGSAQSARLVPIASSSKVKPDPSEGFGGLHRVLKQPSSLKDKAVDATAVDSNDIEHRIQQASISLAITKGDPHGDFSWNIPDPSITSLPKKLIDAKQFGAFESLMTDLRFLIRILQLFGPVPTLTVYDDALVSFAANNKTSKRLEDYREFTYRHLVAQQPDLSLLFRSALSCRQPYVRKDAMSMIQQYSQKISKWSEPETSSRDLTDGTDNTLYHTATYFIRLTSQIGYMYEIGLASCLPTDLGERLHELKSQTLTKLEACRSKLLLSGLQDHAGHIRNILGLSAAGVCEGIAIEQAHKFLDVTQVWDNSDKEEFLALSIYIPKNTLGLPEKADSFERSLQAQISRTAKSSIDQVDIVDIVCNRTNWAKDMNGVALVKFAEVVKSLSVTIVSGKDFPLVDPTGGDPCVTLRLKPRGSGRRKSAHRSNPAQQQAKSSLMAKLSQHVVHQTRSRSGALRSPHPRFGDKFDFVLYEDNQDLEVLCFESDKGPKIPFGESKINVADVINRCHNSPNETFETSFPLFKPGTKKPAVTNLPKANAPPREPSICLRFWFSTKGSKQKGNSPKVMAESVMHQACNPQSALVSGCIVMGPVFRDVPGSWDVVRLYVSSQYYETAMERRFLERFVFPALAIKCLDLRIRFLWSDLSEYGSNGVKENITRRLEAIENCKIRGIDKNVNAIEARFILALMGERRGKLVDERDIRKLELANRHNNSKYRWAVEAAAQGISVQEAEIRSAFLNDVSASEALICLRDSSFTQSQLFLEQVPKQVRLSFIENNPIARASAAAFQRNILSQVPESVIQYSPSFVGYNDIDGVQLGNLEEFGLAVFNRLWKAIRKQYSTCRKMPPVNKYAIEKDRQISTVQAHLQPLVLSTSGSQYEVLLKLAEFTNFLIASRAPVVLLCGGHGSGKSSLMAKLIYDLGEVTKDEPLSSDNVDVITPHKLLRGSALQAKEDWKESGFVGKHSAASESGGTQHGSAPTGHIVNNDHASTENITKNATGSESTEAFIAKYVKYLCAQDLHSADWSFRFRAPRTVFFFKSAAHETSDFLSYMCSALLQTQDKSAASWHRLEDLIRWHVEARRPAENEMLGTPLIFCLDGLNEAEREQMCRIVVSLRGKVRIVMTVDSHLIGQSNRSKGSGSRWQDSVILWNGPLHTNERKAILSGLVERLGPKKMPTSLENMISRPCCADPIYLATMCAYLRCCMDLSCSPVSLHRLNGTTVDILAAQVFPMIENLIGRDMVIWYLHVVMSEPSGLLIKDVEVLLHKCEVDVNQDSLRLLTIAFRPFSDPGHILSTEKVCLNRAFIKLAVYERYHSSSSGLLGSRLTESPKDPGDEVNADGVTAESEGPPAANGVESDEDEKWLSEDDATFDRNEHAEDDSGVRKAVSSSISGRECECWFGSVMLLCNRALFDRFCCSGSLASTGEFHRRSTTMDLNELLHLLRFTSIFPNHVSKTEVVKAFQIANKNAQKQWVYDITVQDTLTDSAADMHEMGFEEFLECMKEIEVLYASRFAQLDVNISEAATTIQRRVRGIKARMQARRAKHEQEYDKLETKREIRDEDVSQIVKLQALARARKERNKLQQASKYREACQKQKALETAEQEGGTWGGPAIKGRLRKNGDLKLIQDKMKALFNTVQDAFVWFDNDGNERISNVELERGFQKLSLHGCNLKKICCLVTADGVVDVLEFMRTFSWHDVRNIEKAVYEAKIQRKIIISRAADRMAVLQEAGKENEEKTNEKLGMQSNFKVFSDSVHVYKEPVDDLSSAFVSWDGKASVL